MPTFKDLLSQIKASIQEIDAPGAHARIASSDGVQLVDVRQPTETADGHIAEAHLIPRGLLELRVEGLIPDKSTELIVYCAGGTRSGF